MTIDNRFGLEQNHIHMSVAEGANPEVFTSIKYGATCPFPRYDTITAWRNRKQMATTANLGYLDYTGKQISSTIATLRDLVQSMNRIGLREGSEPLHICKMTRIDYVRNKLVSGGVREAEDKPDPANTVAYYVGFNKPVSAWYLDHCTHLAHH